jgi:enoyl-CoA hydratase
MSVRTERHGAVLIVTLDRVERCNAVDRATAEALAGAFRAFEADTALSVAVLTGAGGEFCAGADLKAISEGAPNRVELTGDGPMGPSRMALSKPVIAAVEGHAVAGGMELALWCDLRVMAENAVFGVYCRRFGVPLIDGGTVRLPRLIGESRAMDLILTGRPVDAQEALAMGLANRIAKPGKALSDAITLANEIAAFPQACLRNDRRSIVEAASLSFDDAMVNETRLGLETLSSGETAAGATRFTDGEGRGGTF